jgi:hypothetical protein
MEVRGVRSTSCWRRSSMLPLLALACASPMLLVACAGGGVASSPSAPSPTSSPSRSPSPPPPVEIELRSTLQTLSSALGLAHARGRDGLPFEASPSTIAALKHYFKAVDPAKFNGASRVVFVWAYRVPREPDGKRSTATRQYVSAYFWADGAAMVAAGDMTPGLNEEFFRLSRSSPDAKWRVDGLYMP